MNALIPKPSKTSWQPSPWSIHRFCPQSVPSWSWVHNHFPGAYCSRPKMKLLFLSVVSGFFCLKMVLICIYNIHCYGIGVSALSNSYKFYVHLYSCATILHCLSSDTLAHSLPPKAKSICKCLRLPGCTCWDIFSTFCSLSIPGPRI